MKSRREQLLGYLLGALDAAERQQVEAELDRSPALRVEMARYQELLSRLGMDEEPKEFDPPRGLADRAVDFVAAHAEEVVANQVSLASPVSLSPITATTGEFSRGYTITDILVACSVLLTLGALLFPSINNMRLQAQRATCQYRLVQTGAALWDYAQLRPDRRYPAIPGGGNRAVAGNVPLTLVNDGYLQDPVNIICPTADQSQNRDALKLPSWKELDEACGSNLWMLQRMMGGSYAYNMGYTQNGQLIPACWIGREGYALVGDVPSADAGLGPHDGRGCNVLFEDGHVRFLPLQRKPELLDDPYRNRNGYRAAGLDANDSALGPSDARPLPYSE